MIRFCWLTATATLLAASSLASGKEVSLEHISWPAPRHCEYCITVQFGVLELRLPHALVGKIFVPTHTSFPVHLLPRDANDARTSVLLMGSSEGSYISKYARLKPDSVTMRAVNFFDVIGHPAAKGSVIAQVRNMEGLSDATAYTKASKGNVHAYWVRGRSGDSQYLHLVIDGSRDVYSFVGGVTPQLYDAILANLTVKPEP